jgi:dihydrofolate reductase
MGGFALVDVGWPQRQGRWGRPRGRDRGPKAERDGEIEVAGPNLARSLTELGLIDEYRISLHPVVLGHGTPYFAGPRPPLRLLSSDRIGEDVMRLTYVPG